MMVYSPQLRVHHIPTAGPLTLGGVLPKTSGVAVQKTRHRLLERPKEGGCDAKLP